jgi:hypothetical protein
MMKLTREQIAVNAYLKLLQSKGMPASELYKRSAFLDLFAPHLNEKPLLATEFSIAVDLIIESISNEDRAEKVSIAREFYPFWMQDIKTIAVFNSSYHFDFASIQWKPIPSSLDELSNIIEKSKLNKSEEKSLDSYMQTMLENGAEENVIDTRSKLAKLILIKLRDAPVKNNKTYRMAIDIILPVFTINEIKKLFLTVVSEFYMHWSKNI